MKKDWDLIRKILVAVEMEHTGRDTYLSQERLGFSDVGEVFFNAHLHWMEEDNLIVLYAVYANNKAFEIGPVHLTSAGADLLQKIREDTPWERLKQEVLNKAPELTTSALLFLLNSRK